MAARIRKGDTVVVISGVSKGRRGEVLRVLPKTSLNVLPPAPNSGVFDLPMTMPPLRSMRSTSGWDRAGT